MAEYDDYSGDYGGGSYGGGGGGSITVQGLSDEELGLGGSGLAPSADISNTVQAPLTQEFSAQDTQLSSSPDSQSLIQEQTAIQDQVKNLISQQKAVNQSYSEYQSAINSYNQKASSYQTDLNNAMNNIKQMISSGQLPSGADLNYYKNFYSKTFQDRINAAKAQADSIKQKYDSSLSQYKTDATKFQQSISDYNNSYSNYQQSQVGVGGGGANASTNISGTVNEGLGATKDLATTQSQYGLSPDSKEYKPSNTTLGSTAPPKSQTQQPAQTGAQTPTGSTLGSTLNAPTSALLGSALSSRPEPAVSQEPDFLGTVENRQNVWNTESLRNSLGI